MKPRFWCPKQIPADIVGVKRKKTYKTREEARAADRESQARPYFCQYCGYWHLTSRK